MILDEIAKKTIDRMKEKERIYSITDLKRHVEEIPITKEFLFEKGLRTPGLSFICEVKKASPSKGVIVEEFPYIQIAREYEELGATAISCLTEPYYFLGKDKYLKEIVASVSIPVLRKDFTINEYMIYEAKLLGASAILLICAILSPQQVKEYTEIAHGIGLSVLVEAHTENEVEVALQSGSKIIGVNNRNLKDFTVDIQTSLRLRELVPDHFVYVSESGIIDGSDIKMLYDNGTDAVLIGESFMKAKNRMELMNSMRR